MLILRITEVESDFYNTVIKMPNKHLGEGIVMANETTSSDTGNSSKGTHHSNGPDKENYRLIAKFGSKIIENQIRHRMTMALQWVFQPI